MAGPRPVALTSSSTDIPPADSSTPSSTSHSSQLRVTRLPQDLAVEVLSYLNLSDSNSLAHVSHSWLRASLIERRRLVVVTDEMANRLQEQNSPIVLTTVIASPLSRLVTHLPDTESFRFDQLEVITTAAMKLPNLMQMAIHLTGIPSDPLIPFHLPPRLTNISITRRPDNSVAIKHQQICLDALSTATQLQTVYLKYVDPTANLNLNVLTQLPLLTDLTIYTECEDETEPVPDHILHILASLQQLLTLRLGWIIRPEQWNQIHLPLLQHLSLDNDTGPKYSTDLVPLMNTVMVNSICHLRLRLDGDVDLSRLMDLVRFTQLQKLELFRDCIERKFPLTEKHVCDINAALSQLTTLTSLKVRSMYTKHPIRLSELLAASPQLTRLELSTTPIDFSFLCAPLPHERLVELKIDGDFSRSEIIDGLLHCQKLRLLHLYTSTSTAPEWWDQFKIELDSRDVLPALEKLKLKNETRAKTTLRIRMTKGMNQCK